MEKTRFDFLQEGVPYMVHVVPFTFNTETRFRVTYNGGTEHIFAWDEETQRFIALDEDAATIPNTLEEEIAQRLYMLIPNFKS